MKLRQRHVSSDSLRTKKFKKIIIRILRIKITLNFNKYKIIKFNNNNNKENLTRFIVYIS